jgi:hypothetical protein
MAMWLMEPEGDERTFWTGHMMPETDQDAERFVRDQAERAHWAPEEFYASVRETFRELPTASIGHPEVWPLQALYGPGTLPPAIAAKLNEASFHLVRVVCSLRPTGGFRVRRATFQIGLVPDADGRQARAFDLYPLETTRQTKRSTKVTLDPSLKFKELEASVGGVAFGFDYPELEPEVTASGVGESQPQWEYRQTRGTTVQGSKLAYLLVAAPPDMMSCRAALGLSAEVERGGFGLPVRWFRDEERRQAGFTVILWDRHEP